MKIITHHKIIVFILLLLALNFSCVLAKDNLVEDRNISKIEYRFHDASVPSASHRSYSIILTPTELRFVVDSYGQIIKDVTAAISSPKWEQSKRALNDFNIRNIAAKNNDLGCSGGTTISIAVFENNIKSFHGNSYHCGGQNYGDLEGDLQGFLEALKKGIPEETFMFN